MKSNSILVLAIALIGPTQGLRAQNVAEKSHSSGLFGGGGGVGNFITYGGSAGDGGLGVGAVLGYGFTPTWSLYSEVSGAEMSNNGGETYSLAHLDVGARVHVRAGPNTVVPFAQVALSGLGFSQTNNSGKGGGLSFGGGLNAYFNPFVAFTGAITFTTGNLDNNPVGSIMVNTAGSSSILGSKYSVRATSGRIYLGLLWVRPST